MPDVEDGPHAGMPSFPSQEMPQSQQYTSPVRNLYQATPFSAVSPPFPRYNSGSPVRHPHAHGGLLGPIHSAPELLNGHEAMEFRMGSAGPNKSRYRGVSYDKKKRKWRVQIKVGHCWHDLPSRLPCSSVPLKSCLFLCMAPSTASLC